MKKLFIFSITFLLVSNFALAQGCIIIRNISGLGQYNLTTNSYSTSSWQISITNRYFEAYRDYKGTTDLNTPPQNRNIITSYSMNIDVTRLLANGWSLDLGLPISANSRNSNLEHGAQIQLAIQQVLLALVIFN